MSDDIIASGKNRAAYGVNGFGVFDVERDDAPMAILSDNQTACDMAKHLSAVHSMRLVVRTVRMARISWEVERGTDKK